MFKKIADGFLYTVGAFLALNVIGFIDGQTKMYFGKQNGETQVKNTDSTEE